LGACGSRLKTVPTNLTLLSAKNVGAFPAARVAAEIQGGAMTPAHGRKDMPVWGRPSSWPWARTALPKLQLRTRNLTNYLESIQAK